MQARVSAIVCALLLLVPCIVGAQLNYPVLTVTEVSLDSWEFEGPDGPIINLMVSANSALEFSWQGDASAYGGAIADYRYGWDIADPNDPDDVGWATGFMPDLLAAPPRSFALGVHNFYVLVRDSSGAVTSAGFLLDVQPDILTETPTWGEIKSLYHTLTGYGR